MGNHETLSSDAPPTKPVIANLRVGPPAPVHRRKPRASRLLLLVGILLLSTGATLAAAHMNVRSVVVSGPLVTLLGLGVAQLSRPLQSWRVVGFGLLTPLSCALCAALIALFRWSPTSAQLPVSLIFGVAWLLSVPLAIASIGECSRAPEGSRRTLGARFQFSLRSMVILTTVLCLAIAAGKSLWEIDGARTDTAVFGGFALLALLSSVGIAWSFAAERRRRMLHESRPVH